MYFWSNHQRRCCSAYLSLYHPLLLRSSLQMQRRESRLVHVPHVGLTPSHLRFFSRHSSQATAVRRRFPDLPDSCGPCGDLCNMKSIGKADVRENWGEELTNNPGAWYSHPVLIITHAVQEGLPSQEDHFKFVPEERRENRFMTMPRQVTTPHPRVFVQTHAKWRTSPQTLSKG